MVIAVTGEDEDNLVICQVAKRRFNVPRVIARINNPKNEEIFRLLGIDATVSSTDLILSVIEQEIPSQALVPLLRAGLLADESIVVDAASGVSGAGRQATEAYSFCEVIDDVRPYKVLRHQQGDGLFSLWPQSQTYPHLAAYALWGLTVAAAAGESVPRDAFDRGLKRAQLGP